VSLSYREATCRFAPLRSRAPAALDRLTLRAAPGEATCLVGPNGAGKSTALAAAAGLVPLASGAVLYRDRAAPPGRALFGLGYLPQHSRFPRALRTGEVLDFSFAIRSTPEKERRLILALLGLEDKLRQSVGTLSTGWVRRLGIAVALAPPADLLVLDEPFAGLDLDLLDALVPYLLERTREGATLLFASHDFEVADALSARVAVLREGRLVSESSSAPREGSREFYRRSLERGASEVVANRATAHALCS
jgi:ABC-type multidrug transport system ATPase subunit